MRSVIALIFLLASSSAALAQAPDQGQQSSQHTSNVPSVLAQNEDGTWRSAKCSDFKKNQNGSWSPVVPIKIGAVSMSPGAISFNSSSAFSGVNVASLLDAQCSAH